MLTEVSDLADSGVARTEAARRIGVLLQTHAGKLWADQDWQMDVTNEEGLILFVINVQAIKKPGVITAIVNDRRALEVLQGLFLSVARRHGHASSRELYQVKFVYR